MIKKSQPLEIAQVGGVMVARFTQQMIHANDLGPIAEELYALVDERECRKLLLNLASVQYLYSDVLEVILRLHKKVKAAGGRLGLCELQETVREIILTTQLNRLLEIFAMQEEALEALERE